MCPLKRPFAFSANSKFIGFERSRYFRLLRFRLSFIKFTVKVLPDKDITVVHRPLSAMESPVLTLLNSGNVFISTDTVIVFPCVEFFMSEIFPIC